MKFSKRALAALARAKERRESMRVTLTVRPDGRVDIESDFPGPVSTLNVLEKAVLTVKQIGAEQELKAAQGSLAIPTPEVTRQLVGVNGQN